MGLARGAVGLLLEEACKRPFAGRIGTLGRQSVYTTPREVAKQFEKFGVAPRKPVDPAAEFDDVALFELLGFDKVESLDYSDFEGATHVVDLNRPGLPQGLAGRFDVVLDSGTLEHVFHVPNGLANIVSLVKVGGRVIFLSPSSNHIDHGFYMFSPTLFSDYLSANRFRIETLYVVRYSGDLAEPWEAYEYVPGEWRDLHIGGLDDAPYAIFVVASRMAESTTDVIPQQGYYADHTSAYRGSHLATGGTGNGSEAPSARAPAAAAAQPLAAAGPSALRARLKDWLRVVPGALPLARWAAGVVRTILHRARRFRSRNANAGPSAYGARAKKLVGRF